MGESVFSTTWVYTGDDSTAVAKDTQQLGTVTFRSVKGIPFKLKCIALSTRMLTAKVSSDIAGLSWARQTSAVVLVQGTWVDAGDFWWPQGGESCIS